MHKPAARVAVLATILGVALSAYGVALFAANYEFVHTWKNPAAAPLDFSGKKVAAIVMTDDMGLRMSTEEALAREISARGPVASASYRVIPRELLTSKEEARAWFEKSGIDGVVILRLIDVQKEASYSSVVYTSSYYSNFYDYYGYGWTSVVPIGSPRIDTTIAVETVLFTINDAKLIWAGTSETTNPKDAQSYVKGLVNAVGKELQKADLVKK